MTQHSCYYQPVFICNSVYNEKHFHLLSDLIVYNTETQTQKTVMFAWQCADTTLVILASRCEVCVQVVTLVPNLGYH